MRRSIVAVTWVATLLAVQVSRATVWSDDSLPTGAGSSSTGGDSWNWVSSNPAPYSGNVAHQSSAGAGLHSHGFNWAYTPLVVNAGDTISTYVYLDPANPPSEIMLSWNTSTGDWEHRAYWGANSINYGTDSSPSRRSMGALPPVGQWTRLDIPASAVGLEGKTLQGMDFAVYNGRATWDYVGTGLAGSSNPTNSQPGSTNSSPGSVVSTNSLGTNAPMFEYDAPGIPKVGDNMLRIITPNLLELHLVNTKPMGGSVTAWDFINSSGVAILPSAAQFVVMANGTPVPVVNVGFKRRPLYAPLAQRDLRIDNCIYLQLATAVADNATVTVANPGNALWGTALTYSAKAEALRYSPAIHVNQEGYVPSFPKKAMVGYYLGSLGELNLPSMNFSIVDADTGAQVFQGTMTQRADAGYNYSPSPYQKVYQADFSSLTTPGNYRLAVPGLGASMEFTINDGAAMSFARAYQMGLYHQRCGTSNAMPYTRFTHDACHTPAAVVPTSASTQPFTWTTIANYAQQSNADNPVQTAPKLTGPSAQLFPFVRTGSVDTSGGHHDAGDYSKYTINCASLTHELMFAVDALAGVASLDNLGTPESGDGISDILQEAKWEADYLTKIQDTDGGFYFLVYPQNREYENNVTPDHGDAQVVWPKTTSVTAAAVAALAQCASSPLMKQKYPAAAALYLQKAQLGWQFLKDAIARYGKTGAYQKITHYGDDFADSDELAWAACEMFLATGDQTIHQTLKSWFPDPTSTATFRWGWWRMYACYGNAVRSYAFAARSGRLPASALDAAYLAKCEATVTNCANDNVRWSQQCAYGSSFSEEAKRVKSAGWYFSASQAFDIAAAYQISARTDYLDAMVANMNYEGGCNPVNMTYVTGLGWKRQRDIVHGYALNDRRVMPPTGIPLASVQSGFVYLQPYGTELSGLTYPSDDTGTSPYPFYDRWADTWNVTTEFVVTDQARGLGAVAFLAALTPTKNQAWKAPSNAQIIGMPEQVPAGTPITTTLQVPGMDLSGARILWEAKDQQPAYGDSYTFTPTNYGGQWVEAEAQWPDGRRVFAVAGAFAGNNLPTVTVTSADADMTAGVSSDTATFTITRTGPTTNALAVSVQPSGSATKWIDYRRPQGDMPEDYTIPLGASSVTVTVYGVAGSVTSGSKLATWTLRTSDNYNVGSPNATTLTLYANDGSAPQNVAVAASTNASRVGLAPGAFTITRSGSTASAASVGITLGGTAVNGVDYETIPSSVTIPAGASTVTVNITPKTSTSLVGDKTVTLTVSGGTSSLVGTAPSLTIGGNSVRCTLTKPAGAGAQLKWTGVTGKNYRIATRANLTSGNWTDSGSLTATGTNASWTDNATASQKFYVVYVTN